MNPTGSPSTMETASPAPPPKVSVAMLAYNHEKYISQAVQSALMQHTDFQYELVIGEDYSSDRTREIVLDFERRHPDRIRVVLSDRNRGAWENFRQTLRACRGQYIALLDGDDYWTDPRKLQLQADFLDAHPDCALCFHNVYKRYEDRAGAPNLYYAPGQRQTLTVKDILTRNVIPTCSVVVRNGLIGELPAWTRTLSVGDWPFHVLNALHGNIGYLDEILGTFRVHKAGLWSGKDRIERLTGHVAIYRAFRANLEPRYAAAVQSGLSRCYLELSAQYEQRGDLRAAKQYVVKALLAGIFRRGVDPTKLLAAALRLYAPRLWRFARTAAH